MKRFFALAAILASTVVMTGCEQQTYKVTVGDAFGEPNAIVYVNAFGNPALSGEDIILELPNGKRIVIDDDSVIDSERVPTRPNGIERL